MRASPGARRAEHSNAGRSTNPGSSAPKAVLPSRLVLDALHRGWEWMRTHRRRWAPALAIVAALVVGREVLGATPREVDVELPLGPTHADLRQVDVSFLEADELVHHVSLRYPEGAPESVRHRVELAPGSYVVAVDLVHEGGATESREGRLDAPAEGRVRVHLREGS